MNNTNLSSLICSSADEELRGVFSPNEYSRIILHFVVFRRLICVLEQINMKSTNFLSNTKAEPTASAVNV